MTCMRLSISDGTLDITYFNVFMKDGEALLPIFASRSGQARCALPHCSLVRRGKPPAWTDGESSLSDEGRAKTWLLAERCLQQAIPVSQFCGRGIQPGNQCGEDDVSDVPGVQSGERSPVPVRRRQSYPFAGNSGSTVSPERQ